MRAMRPTATPAAGVARTASGRLTAIATSAPISKKARELAEDIMRARQIEREHDFEALVVEFAGHAGKHVEADDEYAARRIAAA